MSLIQTKSYRQEPITLGQDTKGTRHTLSVLATVARQTLGALGGGVPGFPAVAPGGVDGAAAMIAVRDLLMAPRKALRFDVGPRTFVNIPLMGARAGVPGLAALDVELGPKPLAANIIGFNGPQSLLLEYTIQWAMPNPCPDRNGVMAVLAHAWKGEDEISEDLFLTRVYTGIIHFDGRVVGPGSGVNGIHPDTLRALLFPPRTPGCHRRQVQVKNLEDGYSMIYRIVDAQPQAFVNSLYVTRIEASQKVHNISPSAQEVAQGKAAVAEAFAGGAGVGAGILRGLGAVAAGAGGLPGILKGLGAPLAGFVGAFYKAQAAEYIGIPVAVHTFTATAYGSPPALYSDLARAARVVCLFRLMRGTTMAQNGIADYGGYAEQTDTASPKASTISIEVKTRPGVMSTNQAEALWTAGNNRMFTINGNIGRDENITSINGRPIPETIQQLLFGASIRGTPENWGWINSAFAPDLVSSKDAGLRDDALFPRQNLDSPMALMLIRALQDPCAYGPRAGVDFTLTAPRRELP